MNVNTNISEDWGWYIDIENNNYINFSIIEYNHDLKSNKKMNYHLNRLETIEEDNEYDYFKNNYEHNEKILEILQQNNEIKKVEKGFFIKLDITTIITTILSYFTSLMFKIIH
jgi:hypothetical protein